MDIIVELEDGSIANVEIQKISYLFPGQRMSCYSADLLLRQYARVKGQKGAGFTYSDLKKVYTIIIFENSPAELKADNLKNSYVHFGSTKFDSGIEIELLQDYYLISPDVFAKKFLLSYFLFTLKCPGTHHVSPGISSYYIVFIFCQAPRMLLRLLQPRSGNLLRGT